MSLLILKFLKTKQGLNYLSFLVLIAFLSIRISGYSNNSSDSILFSVSSIFKNAILNKDFFLFEVALLILLEVIVFIFLNLKEWRLIALFSLVVLWVFIYINFKVFFSSNLFILSSIPFFLISIVSIVIVVYTKFQKNKLF